MSEISWKSNLTKLVRGEHLSAEETEWFVDDLMKGNADPASVGAVLATQQQLGLTAEEVSGAAKAMVSHAVPLDVDRECTDIVGTGGDGAHTVNLSTMGAVVAAAAGVTIVKHGNRAASSKCGAADCLEALGLPLDLAPDAVAQVANEVGITFAFAKTFHPAMRFVGPVRAALGVPCVFNVLGPLTNPAKPAHMAIGCANRAMSPIMASVYASNGQTGMVYTSREGLDEMAPTGPIAVWEFKDGAVTETTFDPVEELGLAPIELADLRGGEPPINAQAARDLFAGKPVPFRSTALLNAASAIVADGHQVPADGTLAERFRVAYALAERSVDDGKAAALLDEWIAVAKSKVQAA
ncbi:anthranilate phosphoribosyltransferase [Bifidobacterium cuniculi]|uniref:Anthranilate phosphoribosyltransferase n=1 Tax=Bifidobacterium cuniculi TaxID=1688 RepID=A0A087B3P9_9BIFI|nr:anthranilate phosphoribosyltransferase [Bifidobacterium cuniculi]KFI65649.1 anthranilate phosphoribosyltransferase [Bifidobacterium cuniculi]